MVPHPIVDGDDVERVRDALVVAEEARGQLQVRALLRPVNNGNVRKPGAAGRGPAQLLRKGGARV